MHPIRQAALAAAIATALCAAMPAQAADSATEAELRALIQQQAALLQQQSAQITQLNQRLDALEHGAPGAATATAAGTPAAPSPEQAQVDAAVADTRQDDLAILQAQVAQLAAEGGGGGNTRWNRGGPTLRSDDGSFTMHLRGRVMADFSSTHGSAFDARNITGTEMRAVRLGAEGTMGALGYKVDVDFADDTVSVKDAFLSYDTHLAGVPAEFYLGNKLKDRSIDGATTSTRIPFMERNAVASVGSPDVGYFGLGGQMKLVGQDWHVGIGVAGDDLDNTGDTTDGIVYNIRAHWNPLKRSQGFIHLGGWYFYEDLGTDVTSINKTPRIALDFNDNVRVSAGSIADVTADHAWGWELGGVWRSGYAFAEGTTRTIESSSAGAVDQKAQSYYAGWLLTGEKPGFSARSGVWGTTRVLRPVSEGGIGAFELAVRYDNYDFTDYSKGGDGSAWTLGVNWYLNDWTRLMFNLVHWKTDNQVGSYKGPDAGNTIGVRAQVAF